MSDGNIFIPRKNSAGTQHIIQAPLGGLIGLWTVPENTDEVTFVMYGAGGAGGASPRNYTGYSGGPWIGGSGGSGAYLSFILKGCGGKNLLINPGSTPSNHTLVAKYPDSWTVAHGYTAGQYVIFSNRMFVAAQNTTTQSPPASATSTSYWTLITSNFTNYPLMQASSGGDGAISYLAQPWTGGGGLGGDSVFYETNLTTYGFTYYNVITIKGGDGCKGRGVGTSGGGIVGAVTNDYSGGGGSANYLHRGANGANGHTFTDFSGAYNGGGGTSGCGFTNGVSGTAGDTATSGGGYAAGAPNVNGGIIMTYTTNSGDTDTFNFLNYPTGTT